MNFRSHALFWGKRACIQLALLLDPYILLPKTQIKLENNVRKSLSAVLLILGAYVWFHKGWDMKRGHVNQYYFRYILIRCQ